MISKVLRSFGNIRFNKKAKITCITFILSLSIVVVQFAPLLLRLHYSSDSYHLIADQHTTWYLQCGRYIFWLFACLIDNLQINLVLSQRIFIGLCLPCLALSSTMVVRLYSKLCDLEDDQRTLFLVLPASLIWGNVFVEDWLLFPEAAGMIAIGAVMLALSVQFTFSKAGFKSIVASSLCLLLTLGCYQSLVGSYVAAVTIGAVLEGPGEVQTTIKRAAKGIFTGLICAVISVLILKIIGNVIGDSGRGSTFSPSIILLNISRIVDYQLSFFLNADGLLFVPEMQFLEIAGLIAITVLFKKNTRKGILYLTALLIGLAASYAPHYVESNIVLSPRSNVATWMAIGCIAIALFCEALIHSQDIEMIAKQCLPCFGRKVISFCCMAFLIAFIGSNTASIWDISYDIYTSNVQDRNYAQQVANRIKEHEQETATQITGLGIVNDAHVETTYPETRYNNCELGRRIMNCSYANVEMINYLGNLNLETLSLADNERSELFGDRDWSSLNLDEQLVFKGDKAYLVLY